MDKKEISYEIIDYSGITNVKFYTSTDNGSYIPSHWHRSVEILYQTKDPVKKTKLDMLKTTLEQLQIIDDIRPDGFILRFNSLIFELLFQLYHNFGVKIFQSDLSQQKKDLVGASGRGNIRIAQFAQHHHVDQIDGTVDERLKRDGQRQGEGLLQKILWEKGRAHKNNLRRQDQKRDSVLSILFLFCVCNCFHIGAETKRKIPVHKSFKVATLFEHT